MQRMYTASGEVERWWQATVSHAYTTLAATAWPSRLPRRCCGTYRVRSTPHLWQCGLRGHCVDLGRRTRAARLGRPRAGSQHKAAAEQIEAGPAKHLAFQHLEAVDVPLDWAGTPGQGDTGFDRGIVLIQSCGKAAYSLDRTGRRTLEPWIELRRLPLANQDGKILRQVDRLGNLGRLCVELGQLLCLGLGALRLTPQHEPGRPAGRQGLVWELHHGG